MKPKFDKANMAIPSQAPEGKGSGVGVETRWVSPNNNPALRAPRNSNRVEDIVQADRKLSGRLLQRCNGPNFLEVGFGVLKSTTYGLVTEPVTLTALFRSSEYVSIIWNVGVSVRTVGLSLLPGSVFTKISSSRVDGVSDGFKMTCPNALTVMAEVVNLPSFGYRPNKVQIGPTMSTNTTSSSISPATNLESAITIWADKPNPFPTGTKIRSVLRHWTILINPVPKSFFGWHCYFSWHGISLAERRNNVNPHRTNVLTHRQISDDPGMKTLAGEAIRWGLGNIGLTPRGMKTPRRIQCLT